jgi:CSLREA domain-containing protein
MRRVSAVVTVLLMAVTGAFLTACDPVASIVVTTTEDGSDAAPGDGICEVTPGQGDCTLRAALHEAGKSSRATTIEAPAGTYALAVVDADGSTDLDVVGKVTLNWDSSAKVEVLGGGDLGQVAIDVHPGAGFTASGLTLLDGRIQVGGSAVLDRALLASSADALLAATGSRMTVLPGGSVTIGNSQVDAAGGTAIENAGTASFFYTTVTTYNTDSSIDTTGAGATTLQAVRFRPMGVFRGVWAKPSATLCVGTLPQSNGGNWAPNDTCQLTGSADIQTAVTTGTGTGRQYVPTWWDTIPVGVAGCGTTSTVDSVGVARPSDDDGDGDASCDAGNREGA